MARAIARRSMRRNLPGSRTGLLGLCLLLALAPAARAQPRGDARLWLEERIERFGPYGESQNWHGAVLHSDGQFFPVNGGDWNYWIDASRSGREYRLRAKTIPTSAGRLALQLGDYIPVDPRNDPIGREFQPQVWIRGAASELERGHVTYAVRAGELTDQQNFFGWGRSAVGTPTAGTSAWGTWREKGLWMTSLDAQGSLPDGGPRRQVGELHAGHEPGDGWLWTGQARFSHEGNSGFWGNSLVARGGYRNSQYSVLGLVRRISPEFRNLGLDVNPHANEWGTRLEAYHRLEPGVVGMSVDYARDLRDRQPGAPAERRLYTRGYLSARVAGPVTLHTDVGYRDRSTPDPDSLLIDQSTIIGGARLGLSTSRTQAELSHRGTIYRDPTAEIGDWHENRSEAMFQQILASRIRGSARLWSAVRRRPDGSWLSHERHAELSLGFDPGPGQHGWITLGRDHEDANDARYERDQWEIGLGWEQPISWGLDLQIDTHHYLAAGDRGADRSRWNFRLTRHFRFGGGRLQYEETLPEFGQIEGSVFADYDRNGLREPWEPGIPRMVLRLGSGEEIQTDSDGRYLFTQAATGMESVTFDVARLPSRYLAPDEPRFVARLHPRENVVRDIPVRLAAEVAGRVVIDQGMTEVGAPDVLIVVKGTHHDVFTDSEGRFRIPGLEPGTITLEVVEWSLPEKTRLQSPIGREVVLYGGETVYAPSFILEPVTPRILQRFRPEELD